MFGIKYSPHAEVAELADALGSGLSGRKLVRVQVPPSAQLRTPAEKRVSCFNDPYYQVFHKAGHRFEKVRVRMHFGWGKQSSISGPQTWAQFQTKSLKQIIEKRLFESSRTDS
jgi:hypothetical protein